MFKTGDKARLIKNPLDEQLGDYIPLGIKTITHTKDVSHIKGTSGQWVKISEHHDWIDSIYFETHRCNWCGGSCITDTSCSVYIVIISSG
jgi:hypothetical protein